LVDGLRGMRGSPLLGDLHALCRWRDESDNIIDFSLREYDLRTRTGFDRLVTTTEDYLNASIELAKDAM
jgi:hypothetical protein